MPSGTPGSLPRRSAKTRSVCLASMPLGSSVEGPDVAAPRVVDVEDLLVGRERQAVGQHEVVDEQAHGAQIGREAVDPGERQVPLLGRGWAGPGVGEIDRTVGLDHHVVGPVEAPALEAVRDHGEAAVELAPGDPPGVVLAGEQAALQIAGEPVGAVGRLEIHGHALRRRVLHAPVVVDVAEQQVAALLPPQRSLGRSERATEAVGQVLDRLVDRDDLVELDASCSIRFSACACACACACARTRPPLKEKQPAAARTASACRRENPCSLSMASLPYGILYRWSLASGDDRPRSCAMPVRPAPRACAGRPAEAPSATRQLARFKKFASLSGTLCEFRDRRTRATWSRACTHNTAAVSFRANGHRANVAE